MGEKKTAETLKEIRMAKHMTQEELSRASGVSRTIIYKLENGKAESTTSKTLVKLAKALDVPVTALFYGASV